MLETCLKKYLAKVKRWEEFTFEFFFTIFRLIGWIEHEEIKKILAKVKKGWKIQIPVFTILNFKIHHHPYPPNPRPPIHTHTHHTNWNFLRITFYGGMACGDYCCIFRGHRLFLKCSPNEVAISPCRNIKKFRHLRFFKEFWYREKHCTQWRNIYFLWYHPV